MTLWGLLSAVRRRAQHGSVRIEFVYLLLSATLVVLLVLPNQPDVIGAALLIALLLWLLVWWLEAWRDFQDKWGWQRQTKTGRFEQRLYNASLRDWWAARDHWRRRLGITSHRKPPAKILIGSRPSQGSPTTTGGSS